MVTVSTPGGGGYGEPFARDPIAVALDVARGYYTVAHARERFGVVLTPDGTLDEAATAALRARALAIAG